MRFIMGTSSTRVVRLALVLIVVGSSAGSASAGQRATGKRTSSPDPVIADFQHRVEKYVDLSRELQKGLPRQKESVNPAANQASADSLAARIKVARANAHQGDIFTAPIAARLRAGLNPEVRGTAGADTRAAIRDDAPTKFALRVNDSYPDGASRPTMPGHVLAALPPLPAGLEYRIVDRHLILHDVGANLIVDYLFNVM
jgi:hypothetical protein